MPIFLGICLSGKDKKCIQSCRCMRYLIRFISSDFLLFPAVPKFEFRIRVISVFSSPAFDVFTKSWDFNSGRAVAELPGYLAKLVRSRAICSVRPTFYVNIFMQHEYISPTLKKYT
jgi:hypothetical protein